MKRNIHGEVAIRGISSFIHSLLLLLSESAGGENVGTGQGGREVAGVIGADRTDVNASAAGVETGYRENFRLVGVGQAFEYHSHISSWK